MHCSLAVLLHFLPTVPTHSCRFAPAGEAAVDLLSRLLAFDPSRRCSPDEALAHEYFADMAASDNGAAWPLITGLWGVTCVGVRECFADLAASKRSEVWSMGTALGGVALQSPLDGTAKERDSWVRAGPLSPTRCPITHSSRRCPCRQLGRPACHAASPQPGRLCRQPARRREQRRSRRRRGGSDVRPLCSSARTRDPSVCAAAVQHSRGTSGARGSAKGTSFG